MGHGAISGVGWESARLEAGPDLPPRAKLHCLRGMQCSAFGCGRKGGCADESAAPKAIPNRMSDALERIQRLRAVRFDWTADAPQGRAGSDFGLIAEEVAEVVPEVVAREADGTPRGVDYARLTALLVEAVKAQQEEIAELRRELGMT